MTANAHHFHPLTPFVMQQTGPSYQSFVNVFLCLATGFWHFPLRIAGKKKKKENKRNYTMGNYNAEMFTNLLSPRVRGQRKRKIIGLSLERAITQWEHFTTSYFPISHTLKNVVHGLNFSHRWVLFKLEQNFKSLSRTHTQHLATVTTAPYCFTPRCISKLNDLAGSVFIWECNYYIACSLDYKVICENEKYVLFLLR